MNVSLVLHVSSVSSWIIHNISIQRENFKYVENSNNVLTGTLLRIFLLGTRHIEFKAQEVVRFKGSSCRFISNVGMCQGSGWSLFKRAFS